MGVLNGLEVLDLSWGISGPMTGMLLADHGARVTKIEPPGGDPWRSQSGYRTWNRGKRSAVLNLKDPPTMSDSRHWWPGQTCYSRVSRRGPPRS